MFIGVYATLRCKVEKHGGTLTVEIDFFDRSFLVRHNVVTSDQVPVTKFNNLSYYVFLHSGEQSSDCGGYLVYILVRNPYSVYPNPYLSWASCFPIIFPQLFIP